MFQTFITAGKPELMAPVLFTRKVPLVSLNRKTHISPSTKSRLLQATGALADGFLRLVSSKVTVGRSPRAVQLLATDGM